MEAETAELHTPQRCKIEGCDRGVTAHGWCYPHYRRWLRHGNPLGGRPARTPHGHVRAYLEQVLAYTGNDCLEWAYAKNQRGYGVIQWHRKKRGAHQVICELANGPRPSAAHQAAHNCGNGARGCCNPKHLRWATRADNMADKSIHGTQPIGEKNPRAKLKREDVVEIRKRLRQGVQSQGRIAQDFGVSRELIQRINSRKAWASLPETEGVGSDAP